MLLFFDAHLDRPLLIHKKQGVALAGRNTTGPPRAAPGELRCAVECYRWQTPVIVTSL